MDFLTRRDQVVNFTRVKIAQVTLRLLKSAALVSPKKMKTFSSAATLSNGQLIKGHANSTGVQISCIKRKT